MAFNQWANAAALLYTLGRDQEAFDAATNSLNIFPGSSVSRLVRARLLLKKGLTGEAESEFRAAADLEDNSAIWLSLARMYRIQKRYPAAIDALKHAIEFSPRPFAALVTLGNVYIEAQAPKEALEAFDRAQKSLPNQPELAVGNTGLAELAQGRSLAWRKLGNLDSALAEQEESVRLDPNASSRWLQLADLYEKLGRSTDAEKARKQAASMAQQ